MNIKIKAIFLSNMGFLLSFILQAQEVFISNKLEKVWEISSGLDVPESSYYNPFDKTIYVSNIVGRYNVKDGLGYISKVSLDGKIIRKEWVNGLNGPKGMSATKQKLFVTDFDRVLEIEIPSGKFLKEYKNTKSKDLNDVVIASDGRVYVTDSGSDCLFFVGKDSLEVYLEDDLIKGMNGIYTEGNILYIGAQGNLLSIGLQKKGIKVLASNVGYVDGIFQPTPGVFITSDYGGKIQLIQVGKGSEKLLDTSSQKINAADLGYIPSQKILLVPTFSNNKVTAYKMKL